MSLLWGRYCPSFGEEKRTDSLLLSTSSALKTKTTTLSLLQYLTSLDSELSATFCLAPCTLGITCKLYFWLHLFQAKEDVQHKCFRKSRSTAISSLFHPAPQPTIYWCCTWRMNLNPLVWQQPLFLLWLKDTEEKKLTAARKQTAYRGLQVSHAVQGYLN